MPFSRKVPGAVCIHTSFHSFSQQQPELRDLLTKTKTLEARTNLSSKINFSTDYVYAGRTPGTNILGRFFLTLTIGTTLA